MKSFHKIYIDFLKFKNKTYINFIKFIILKFLTQIYFDSLYKS